MPHVPAAATATATKSAIRDAAVRFATRHAHDSSEEGQKQTFWDEFFDIFGVRRTQVAVFERLAQRSSTGRQGWIDLLFPGQLAVEHKSRGGDMNRAMSQVIDYLPSLTAAEHPWLLLVCDFERFDWQNLESGERGSFLLQDLPDNLDLFWWIAGYNRPGQWFENEEQANLQATELLAKLHDHLRVNGYPPHALREWLTRILFCLFADDTRVWDRAAFHAWVAAHTRPDGSDLGPQLAYLFQLLNTPKADRPANLDEELDQFIYVNGDLFSETLPIPNCDREVREALLRACAFDWTAISPAIFGSMFQNVMEPSERRQLGAHYTSEENILKTIGPLFLDPLREQLDACTTKQAIQRFLDRLPNLTFFDPACGCGNFLVVAYRELRRIEAEALGRWLAKENREGYLAVDVTLFFRVRVSQFYGIELEEFPAKIARTALYLMDHLANLEVSHEFGENYARFPIPAAPHIVNGDALDMDWNGVLPADDCDYCFGNPPFAGHITRSRYQSDQMRGLWGRSYNKLLDYVTAWYRKSLDYGKRSQTRFAFVSTNSIAQGEQVARLWTPLLAAGFVIDFAYQTFKWTNEASGRANVHVVIVGFSAVEGPRRRRLFTHATYSARPVEVPVRNINGYLVDGPNTLVHGRTTALSPLMPPVKYGSLASDGGALVINRETDLPIADATAMKYVRRYVGSQELLHGDDRWCLWMPNGTEPGDVEASPFLAERLAACRAFRLQSVNPDTVELAAMPYRFFHRAQPVTAYLGIPAQVSETRRWYTVAHLGPEVIASNTLYTAEDPDGFLFGVLSSAMFMVWQRAVGGALESRLRFSSSVVHNTFPLPSSVPQAARRRVIEAGQGVLESRPAGSLASIYNPLSTSPDLLAAHGALDRAVDGLFRPRARFESNQDRLVHLLAAYETLSAQGELRTASRRVR